jgi:polyhydroxyalkanoate synthase subunit PhaC
MAQSKAAAVLSTPPEAVPDVLEPSHVPMQRPVTEKIPTPMEAWMAASRLAPLLGLTAARDDDQSLRQAEVLDRSLHYSLSRVTLGLSPMALAETYFDWLVHLSLSPGKQLQLWQKGLRKSTRLANHLAHSMAQFGHSAEPCICPLPQDKRFSAPDWHQWPFNVIHQSFLLQQQWWHNATTGIRGVSPEHERALEFGSRQLLDVFAPSNFLLTNPEILKRTQAEAGQNLARGFWNFVEDWERVANGRPPFGTEQFKVGEHIAATPGKVVFRNRLMELIQYVPLTAEVRPEPILIVPAWIMKYYILDLSPKNSLVRYLLEQGFTVFMISWKNPGLDERDLGMEDYHTLGPVAALDAISGILPDRKVHGVGYCLGGTLLATSAAAMARDDDERFKTMSFLAAQTDFTEAGELTLFISESQVAFLEDIMWEQGYLQGSQMAGAFQILRSNDLIWSRIIRNYFMGERQPVSDMMAWNADATRLPYKMHSEYLRKLFLGNDLAEGRFKLGNRPIALSDIRTPIFAVGTETDHVAPWHSVYKFNLLMDAEVTFLLTSGGHNAGIVSEPGHPGRHYRVACKVDRDRYIDPDTWIRQTVQREGSWWPEWSRWLGARSGRPTTPPEMGAPHSRLPPLADAPGGYVLKS